MEQLRLFASLLCGALLSLKNSLRAFHIRNGPEGAVLGTGSFIRGRVSLLSQNIIYLLTSLHLGFPFVFFVAIFCDTTAETLGVIASPRGNE